MEFPKVASFENLPILDVGKVEWSVINHYPGDKDKISEVLYFLSEKRFLNI